MDWKIRPLPCQIGKDGTSSGQDRPHRGIGFDELNNELQRTQITFPVSRRLNAANRDLIWPCPPPATLRPPHLLIHILTDRPALSPHHRRHELRKHHRLDFYLADHQFVGEMPL